MTNKELFYFVGKCLTIDEHPGFRQEIIDRCKDDSFDWQPFVAHCSNHLILPVIYLKFKSQNLLNYLPKELEEHLKEIYELNASRNTQIQKQLQRITHILNQNKIEPLFFKGSGNLLDELYSDIGERILGDIDFLVPEKDYLESVRLMENDGYVEVTLTPDYTNIKSLKHYPRQYHPDFVAVIEIHRIPVRENNISWFNTAIIDKEKEEVASLKGCYVESDNHKITHNFIHSQLSNGGHANGIVSFRDLYDLYLLSKRSHVKETISQIKRKKKAIAYFSFAGKAFGMPGRFGQKANLTSWLFSKKHALNMSSDTFYQTNRILHFMGHRIFTKYIGQIMQSLCSRNIRQSLLDRLSDRSWYKAHLNLYISFFTRNK